MEKGRIRRIELELVERGWKEGWIKPLPPAAPSGFRVGVIGSGPAGLAAANFIAIEGHRPVIFEKLPKLGGMLRYGIPEYRLPRKLVVP